MDGWMPNHICLNKNPNILKKLFESFYSASTWWTDHLTKQSQITDTHENSISKLKWWTNRKMVKQICLYTFELLPLNKCRRLLRVRRSCVHLHLPAQKITLCDNNIFFFLSCVTATAFILQALRHNKDHWSCYIGNHTNLPSPQYIMSWAN